MTRQEAVKAIAAKQIELGGCSQSALDYANKTAGRILGKLIRKPWQTAAQLTEKDRAGRLHVSYTSRHLANLKAVGAVQNAWDEKGYSCWAPCGTELTSNLTQE